MSAQSIRRGRYRGYQPLRASVWARRLIEPLRDEVKWGRLRRCELGSIAPLLTRNRALHSPPLPLVFRYGIYETLHKEPACEGIGSTVNLRDNCAQLKAQAMRWKIASAEIQAYARTHKLQKIWLRGQDLNLRPSGYEPDELPDCSTPRLSPLVYTNLAHPSRKPLVHSSLTRFV